MINQVTRIMVWPQLVPIRVLIKMGDVGLYASSAVHKHIRSGSLQSLKGIGPKWEAKIIHYYSATPQQLAKDILKGKTRFVS